MVKIITVDLQAMILYKIIITINHYYDYWPPGSSNKKAKKAAKTDKGGKIVVGRYVIFNSPCFNYVLQLREIVLDHQ